MLIFTVIRIFGIYAHSQVDQRFWDIMSRQLGSRGPEYRKRCIYRRWKTIRDLAVLPGEFSPMPDEELAHATSSPSPGVTTREDMEQVRIFVMVCGPESMLTLLQLHSLLA